MGSPLVFGGFNGWTVVGDRLSYTVGRAEYDDTFVGNAEGYPATEIDFRFGYWIGVPMHKGKKT